MSLLLALFSIGLGASLVKEVAKDTTKVPARSRIEEKCKSGNFNVVENFEDILYVCDVKRKSLGNSSVKVLPYTGYKKCLPYIREHHLTSKADEQVFVDYYRKVLSEELGKRQKDYDKHYSEVASEVKTLMNTDEYEIVRFEHIDVFVDYQDVEMKVNEICNKTFLGNFVIGDVKIKLNSSGNAFTEIWALKIPVAMRASLNRYYDAAAQKCGYIY